MPETEFRLYAVCSRFPQTLAGQVPMEEQQAGVYDCRWGTDVIRVLVARQLPEKEPNGLLHLFSLVPALIEYARRHYRLRSPDTSTLLDRLLEGYRQEGLFMPYTIEDFRKEYRKEFLEGLTPEERVQVIQKSPPEKRLEGLSAEKRLEGLSAEEILKLLPPEEIERYLKRRKNDAPSTSGEHNL